MQFFCKPINNWIWIYNDLGDVFRSSDDQLVRVEPQLTTRIERLTKLRLFEMLETTLAIDAKDELIEELNEFNTS